MEGHGPQDKHWRGALDGARIWWLNPTVKGTRNIWRMLKWSLKELIARELVIKRETERSIEFPGGGFVELHTADDPDSLRGPGIDGCVLDEAAFMKPAIWANVVEPMLMDTLGWAMFTTTPNGFNWFQELCQNTMNDPEWEQWALPTWANRRLPVSEQWKVYNRVQSGDPVARQENGAEFVEGVGSEFGRYLGEDVWFTGPMPTDCELKVVAIDMSKGRTEFADYTAIVILGVDPRKHFWVDCVMERMPLGTIVDQSLEVVRQVQPHAVVWETNQFQELLANEFSRRAFGQNILAHVVGFDNMKDKKETRIRRSLSYILEHKRIHFRHDSEGAQALVSQLRTFPNGDFDDGPDALEMAVRYWGETATVAV